VVAGSKETSRWLDYLIPLPKEVTIRATRVVPAGQIGLSCRAWIEPTVAAALDLLEPLALDDGFEQPPFLIRLALLGDQGIRLPVGLGARLAALPHAEQAYAIVPFPHAQGLLLLATTGRGLLNAARTLVQLAHAPAQVTPETELEIPLATIVDWPDLEERGQWGGNVAEDIDWTSQWKLNTVEVWAQATVDPAGQPIVQISPDLIAHGAKRGVKVVPYILHLEQVSRHAGLMSRQELLSTPDPSQPLPSDYTPGLCMSSPDTQELIRGWLAAAARIEGVTDIMVWLSEGAAPCYCPKCLGKEPFGLEVQAIVQAFARAEHPGVRLRLLTTQGSYPVNDQVIAAAPQDVGITYYDGGRTYDSSHAPMIYPLLQDYARSGRWLGVYPQITHCWRTVFPWTAPQFMQYRAQEFADKGLRCVIGYAVPSNRFHEFNVMAEAEWTWNAHGRSPEAFARAYAVAKGIADPDGFARWALLQGAAGWVLAESRLLLTMIYDPARGLRGESPVDDHRFESAGIVRVPGVPEALAQAREALALAQSRAGSASDPAMIDESAATLAGLEALDILYALPRQLAADPLDDAARGALCHALDRLDQAAAALRRHTLAWGERIYARIGQPPHTRLLDTANVLLRTCDAARQLAAERGLADPHPEYRLRPLRNWSADDFCHSQSALLTVSLDGLVAQQGGEYHVGLDFADGAWGTSIEWVGVLARNQSEASWSIIAETPDPLGANVNGVSIWERWKELRLAIPATPPGTALALAVRLWGMPVDAPAGRRTCAGRLSWRRAMG